MGKNNTNTFQTFEFLNLTELPFIDSFLIPGLVDNVKEALMIYFLLENGMTLEQKYLSQLLRASNATISIITENLIRKGLIEQKRNDIDHRGHNIYLTKLGIKVGKWMLFRRSQLNQIELRGFTKKEIDASNNLLKKMATNLIDASDRELRNLSSFEEFNEEMVSEIPSAISHYDKLQFISLSTRVKKHK